MITLTLSEDKNKIYMFSHYYYRRRCAKIPGSEFDYDMGAWVTDKYHLPAIEAEFKGELYYKTPRWAITGEEAPLPKEPVFYFPKKDVPKAKCSPYSYQKDGVQFMIDRLNSIGFCLNGDGMGLGKTLQSILTMTWMYQNNKLKKTLIVCKKSVKSQWKEEINKHCIIADELEIFITGETKKKREKAYEAATAAEKCILITNYHNFLNDTDLIRKIGFGLTIIDEAHSVKGREGKMNNNISSIANTTNTILLTGTPIMSKPDDLYGVVGLANSRYFGEYRKFAHDYLTIDYQNAYGPQIVGAKNLEKLHEKIGAFMIRRTADDPKVKIDLPEVNHYVEYAEMDYVQKAMYEEILEKKGKDDMKRDAILKDVSRTAEEKIEALEELNDKGKMYIASMQFICDDPKVFDYLPKRMSKKFTFNEILKKQIPKSYGMSAKSEATIDKIEEILSEGEKVIVFTHYASAARMLKDYIVNKLKVNVVMYTGAEKDEVRDENVRLFKTSPNYNILIGTDAAAEGLNLQVAKYMIQYEMADTDAQAKQRIGRIKRIGSVCDTVTVIDMCSRLTEKKGGINSFDQIKIEKLKKDEMFAEASLAI